jgi:hypothetical protein
MAGISARVHRRLGRLTGPDAPMLDREIRDSLMEAPG